MMDILRRGMNLLSGTFLFNKKISLRTVSLCIYIMNEAIIVDNYQLPMSLMIQQLVM